MGYERARDEDMPAIGNSLEPGVASFEPEVRRSALRKFLSMVAGYLLMLMGGLIYMVSAYSKDFQKHVHWDDKAMVSAKSWLTTGVYVSLHLGLLLDVVGSRLGSFLAAVLFFGGYFILYLTVKHQYGTTTGFLGWIVVGQGSYAAFQAALYANVGNFGPQSRGAVAGFLLSGFGLSSAIFGQLYAHGFNSDVEKWVMVMMIMSTAVGLLGSVFLYKQDNHTAVKAAELVDTTSLTPGETLRSGAFWLLYIIIGGSVGANVFFIQDLSNICEALNPGCSTKHVSDLLLVLALCNVGFRLIGGWMSDWALAKLGLARPWILVLSCIFTAAACVPVYVGGGKAWLLWPASVLMGVGEGFGFSVYTSIVRETFGPKYYGVNLSLIMTALGGGTAMWLNGVVGSCKQESCMKKHFLIILITTGVCALVSVVLTYLLRQGKEDILLLWDRRKRSHFVYSRLPKN